ncbi:glycoside hydrolase domain-containing protein [Kitasatospora sp. NPDC085464]|uniref:glycoside hydrolase domain-containing protein n=1 Tax=Kitasatospora sp. NPDC085464 TaxID=3364063 RepID=UPI0037C6A076
MHLGFDRSDYPGDAVMQSLWDNTPLAFAAAYLAPAPSHPNTSWMSAVPTLTGMGWGLAPVFVGQQAPGGPGSHVLTAAQGTVDAQTTESLGQTAGLAPGAVVYLDVEIGGRLTPDHLAYVAAWANSVTADTSYNPGVYCSFSQTAAQITAEVGSIPVWVFHPVDAGPSQIDLATENPPDPANSGFAGALVWQYRMSLSGSVNLNWTDSATPKRLQQVDLDSATCLDPSHPDQTDRKATRRRKRQLEHSGPRHGAH